MERLGGLPEPWHELTLQIQWLRGWKFGPLDRRPAHMRKAKPMAGLTHMCGPPLVISHTFHCFIECVWFVLLIFLCFINKENEYGKLYFCYIFFKWFVNKIIYINIFKDLKIYIYISLNNLLKFTIFQKKIIIDLLIKLYMLYFKKFKNIHIDFIKQKHLLKWKIFIIFIFILKFIVKLNQMKWWKHFFYFIFNIKILFLWFSRSHKA